ncbi:MAG: glycosyltransferase family 4 protein [Chitinophagaceae bacterium]|nr:glycosyltransferase family 4 protein [Chitinophagaceae bacterium]
MKITYIIPSLNEGGAEILTIAQANELVKRGVKVQVIILSDNSKLVRELDPAITIFILNERRLRYLNIKSIFPVFKSIYRINLSISEFSPEHIIAVLPLSFLIARILKCFFKIKGRVWIYHRSTEYLENPPTRLSKKIYNLLFVKILSSKKEHHLFISNAVKDDILQHEKIRNGYILHNSSRKQERELKERELLFNQFKIKNKEYIIFPGTLKYEKGHLFFLKSTVDIIKSKNLKLLIVGGGHLEDDIRTFITNHRISDNVILTGNLENKKLLQLVSGAYLCVIPSIIEGFGNVAVEALSVGTTILCSNSGGLPEIIKHKETGYIFESKNENDLKHQFEEIIDNPSLLIPPEILISEYDSRFSLQTHINNFLRIINTPD